MESNNVNSEFELQENPSRQSLLEHAHLFYQNILDSGSSSSQNTLRKFLLSKSEGGHVLGSAYFYIQHDILCIESIAVDKKFQKIGYGAALIEQIIQLAKEKQVEVLVTTTMESYDSKGFWLRMGFKAFGQVPLRGKHKSVIYFYRNI